MNVATLLSFAALASATSSPAERRPSPDERTDYGGRGVVGRSKGAKLRQKRQRVARKKNR